MANATYQLSIAGTHYNQFVENVICFKGDLAAGIDTMAESEDLVESWLSNVVTAWLACVPPTYLIDRLSARCLLPAGPSSVFHHQVINDAHIGTFGTAAASENLCPAVNLIPPMGVKSQGRVYLPCVAKTAIDNNKFVAGYITAVNALFNLMAAGFANSATTWKTAVYSKKNGTSSLSLAHSLSAAIGFQGRRRRPI
jgi:hypothetical protein